MKYHKHWKERVDIWTHTDNVYSFSHLKSMASVDRTFEMKIKQIYISQKGKKYFKRKFKKMEQDTLPLKKKYDDIMPKAKKEVIRYLCECNNTLTDTNEIVNFDTTTDLMQTLIPHPTKVVCLSEAATSEIVDFETTRKLLVTLIPKPTKVVCLSEDALDLTPEPSDDEENEWEDATMEYEDFKSETYKMSKLEKY